MWVCFAAALFLAVAVCLVFARAASFPFVFDDDHSIAENPSVVQLWPLWGDSKHPGPLDPPTQSPTSGRPLVNLSLAMNYHFGRLDPLGYRVFNLVVHWLSALVLMAIVCRTLRLDYFGGRFDRASPGAPGLAFAVALLWSVHPLQTETVVYITQRTELLVGFFYLATLYSSMRYWGAASPAGRTAWLIVSMLSCSAGMACKEVMVTAPVIVLLFERTFVTGSFRGALRKSWPLYVGLALGWAVLLWLNWNAPRSNTAGFHLGISVTDWWLTQTKVLWMYLKLAIWPWPLVIHYEFPYLTSLPAAWPWVLATGLLIVAVIVLVWRRNPIGFVGAWVLVILSPTLVVPIVTEMAAERRMYLPLAALAALWVVGGCWILQRIAASFEAASPRRSARIWPAQFTVAAAFALAVTLGLVSVHRLQAYQSALALWQDAVINQPDDFLADTNLGNALRAAGRLPEAIAQHQQSLRLNPGYYRAHNNLGVALSESGRPREAILEFEESLRLEPNCADTYNNLGNALAALGQTQEAIEKYQRAIELNRYLPDAHFNFGTTLQLMGRLPEAIELYRQAIECNPEYVDAHNNLAVALMAVGRPEEAIEQFKETARLEPTNAAICANLMRAYARLQRREEAIAAAEKGLALAQAQGETGLIQEIDSWLADYRAAKEAREK